MPGTPNAGTMKGIADTQKANSKKKAKPAPAPKPQLGVPGLYDQAPAAPTDPNLQALLQQYASQVAGAAGPNYDQMASDAFGPQFAALDNQGNTLRHDASAGSAKLKSLYGNLVNSIQGDKGIYDAIYKSSLGDVNASNSQALGAIGGTYDASAEKEAAMLQRLGIQDAAPDVFKQGAIDRNFFSDLVNTNDNAYKNQFNAEHGSSLTFNQQQADISKQTGVDAQASLQQKLQDALAQLASQRAGLQTQESQYSQSLQGQQAIRDTDLAKLQLQYGPQSAAAQTAAQKQAALTGPGGLLATEAAKLYPNQNSAQNAIKAVLDTLSMGQGGGTNGHTWSDATDFERAVLQRNPGAQDKAELQDLALLLFNSLK